MSTLGYAILGLLAAQPRTGYDLARLMRTPIGYMWTAHHSQIYPELARLESEGLVAATVIDGPGPRDTKRYEITPRRMACPTGLGRLTAQRGRSLGVHAANPRALDVTSRARAGVSPQAARMA